MYFESV